MPALITLALLVQGYSAATTSQNVKDWKSFGIRDGTQRPSMPKSHKISSVVGASMRLTTLAIVGILSANAIGQNLIKLSDAALTSQQRREITHAIDSGAYGGCLDENGTPCARSAEFIRLSPNTSQIVVTLFLGGAGNQSIWVFNLANEHPVLLLSDEGSGYGSLATIHNGMHELVISGPCGGGHCVDKVYRFDGKHYEVAYCNDRNLGETGEMRSGPRRPCTS